MWFRFDLCTGLTLAGAWALLLPPVERSMYFHREVNDKQPAIPVLEYSSIPQNKDLGEDTVVTSYVRILINSIL